MNHKNYYKQKNKNNGRGSLKKTHDNTPQKDIIQDAKFKMTESNEDNNNNIDIKRNQELFFELENYK